MHARSSQSPASQDALSRSRRQRNRRLFVASGLACLAIAFALWSVFGKSRDEAASLAEPHRISRSETAAAAANGGIAAANAATAERLSLIEDDGHTLWTSPTDGQPVDLAYLPPGGQIFVVLRPQALANHREGTKVLDALGPLGQHGIALLGKMLLDREDVTQVIVALNATSGGQWQTALVARLRTGITAAEHLATKLPDAVEKTHHDIQYLVSHDWAYYTPAADDKLLIVAPAASITEIIDLRGEPPPLRREVDRVLAHTDADRHFTMIVAPNFLFSEGEGVFAGQMAPLRDPLFRFLGDEFGAAALSMHWDDNFFAELLAVPTLDTSPERAARVLTERVAETPDRLEEYVVGLQAQAYGRRVLARFPAMVRKLAAYTRSGFESDHAVLRCYLPAVAGHNLLMGAELTLAESIGATGSKVVAGSTSRTVAGRLSSPKSEATAPSGISSIHERLRQNTSLSFPRETLEAALEQLSRDIGVDIVIAGADLQAEGITKNLSFGMDLSNRSAEEILVEILRMANSDKSAAGPSDTRQKLVYVVAGDPEKGEYIVITTRAQALSRGDGLPGIFRTK
jgi:hypothetical protein